jgi:hypothetical protein
LAEEAASGWRVTAQGRQPLAGGAVRRSVRERRQFWFVEVAADRPPHFLPVQSAAALAWPAGPEGRFNAQILTDCVGRPAEWKDRFGFPPEIEQIYRSGPETDEPPAWQRVIVDRPHRLTAVLLFAGAAFLGFAVREDGWTLQAESPAFTLGNGAWQVVFPELAADLPDDDWRRAWRGWCKERNLSVFDDVPLQIGGATLHVSGPHNLRERLLSTKSDALKGEAWVLAGSGRLHQAARLEIVATS